MYLVVNGMCRFGACLVVIGLINCTASADSIKFDGKTYDNVIIRSGNAMYYIQIPLDGKTISVPKKKVNPADVYINPDEKFRELLLKRWKAAYSRIEGESRSSSTLSRYPKLEDSSNEPKNQTIFKHKGIEALKTESGVPLLTSMPEKYRNRRKADPVFFDKKGVILFTCYPENYRKNSDFIEVSLSYESIVVPEKYTNLSFADQSSKAVFSDIVSHYSRHYNLDEALVYAVIKCESNFSRNAISRCGARGLMQLMPGTAVEMGVSDIFDPAQNIAGGTQYLRKMLNLFNGNVSLALAGYNAGPGNVKKYRGIPPFKETQKYVRRVQNVRRKYAREGVKPALLAKVDNVKFSYLPDASNANFVIRYHNGLTQPADVVIDGGSTYHVEYQNITTQIRKEYVKKIDKVA